MAAGFRCRISPTRTHCEIARSNATLDATDFTGVSAPRARFGFLGVVIRSADGHNCSDA